MHLFKCFASASEGLGWSPLHPLLPGQQAQLHGQHCTGRVAARQDEVLAQAKHAKQPAVGDSSGVRGWG